MGILAGIRTGELEACRTGACWETVRELGQGARSAAWKECRLLDLGAGNSEGWVRPQGLEGAGLERAAPHCKSGHWNCRIQNAAPETEALGTSHWSDGHGTGTLELRHWLKHQVRRTGLELGAGHQDAGPSNHGAQGMLH